MKSLHFFLSENNRINDNDKLKLGMEIIKRAQKHQIDRIKDQDFIQNNPVARASIAQRGFKEHLDELVDDPDKNVRAAVAEHGHKEHLDKLVHDPERIVRAAVAEHGHQEHLNHLLSHDPYEDTRITVINKIKPEALKAHFEKEVPGKEVWNRVGNEHLIPIEQIIKENNEHLAVSSMFLHHDPAYTDVFKTLIDKHSNPTVPRTIARLTKSPVIMKHLLDSKSSEHDHAMISYLTGNDDIDRDTAVRLATNPGFIVRRQLLQNLYTRRVDKNKPQHPAFNEVVDKIIDDPDERIRQYGVYGTPEHLDHLVKDHSQDIRLRVVTAPHVQPRHLNILSKDPSVTVRHTLANYGPLEYAHRLRDDPHFAVRMAAKNNIDYHDRGDE